MRQLSFLAATTVAFFIFISLFLMSRTSSLREPVVLSESETAAKEAQIDEMALQASGTSLDLIEADIERVVTPKNPVTPGLTQGHAIMPQLNNETIKAELGRASWKLFHTILARFPENPTLDEREALKSYIHLFARLYPCGECAEHFQGFLASNPPQTSSREAASQWGCHIHNKVNESLNKKIFDCSTIAEVYKCGCDEENEKEGEKKDVDKKVETQSTGLFGKGRLTESKTSHTPLQYETAGLTRGG